MKHRNTNLLYGLLFVLFLLIVFIYFPSSNFLNKSLKNSTIISIDKDVSFQWNQEEKKIVDIGEYSFDAPHRGEQITLEKVLPDKDIVHPVLVLELYHCVVDVYIDETKIYSYGQELYTKKKVLGHEFLRIPLPENFQGKNLKIQLTVTEEDGFTSMEDMYILNEGVSYSKILVEKLLTLLSCLTLITFGIIAIGSSIVMRSRERDIRTFVWIGCFSIIIAMWMLCNDDIMFMFISNTQIVNVIEFFSVYLPGIPVTLFFANVIGNEKWRKIFLGFAILNGMVNVMIVIVHLAKIANYVVWIPVMHIILISIIIFIVYTLIISYRQKKNEIRVLVYGMAFMVIISLFELLRFNLYKYLNQFLSERFSLMPIGALIFTGSMLYCYCIRLLRKYHEKAEQETIEKMAYTDMLTNTYNRNKCEKVLEQMEENAISGYLISMDLNGLKQVNDTYGHSRGDQLLVNFSKVLHQTFQKYSCVVGRMGGDEFVVIMYENQEQNVVSALKKLNENLMLWNKKHEGDVLSVAYGYAYYDGRKKSSIQTVYEKADKKMYESKRKIKSQKKKTVLF